MLTVNKILNFSLARVFLFYFGAQILFLQVCGKLAGRVSLMRWPGAPQLRGLPEEDLPGSGGVWGGEGVSWHIPLYGVSTASVAGF